MATYEVHAPDGSILTIEGPEGATDEQLISAAQEQFNSVPIDQPAVPQPDMLPSPTGGLEPVITPPAQTEPTLGEQAVGVGEAALAAAVGGPTALVGQIGGTLKGLAEQILSGEFGSQEAAALVQAEAQKGAQAGAELFPVQPETSLGKEYLQNIATAGEALTPIAPVAAGLAPLTSAARAAAPVAKGTAAGLLKGVTPAQKRIADKIQADPSSTEIVKYIEKGVGRIGKDVDAVEAIKQGFDEGVVATVKGASEADRKSMRSMMKILKLSKKSAGFAARNRPTDVAGNTLVKSVNKVMDINRTAGKSIEKALTINSIDIQNSLQLPAQESYCALMAEDVARAAIEDVT